MSTNLGFLSDRKARAWTHNAPGFQISGFHLGKGVAPQLEVLVAVAPADRSTTNVRSLWKARHGSRAVPLLVAVIHDESRVTLCGPVGIKDDPPVHPHIDRGQAERVCREALDQPNKEAALRYLRDTLPAIQSALPGVRNQGFLATHELERGAPSMAKWAELTARGRTLSGKADTDLLQGLGFELDAIDSLSSLLKASGTKSRTGVAVVLQSEESPDLESLRFNGLSPVTYAMAVADRENLRYVLVCQGPKVRLYPVGLGVGVGRRGRTETFIELHTGIIRDDHAGYICALLSAEALVGGGTLEHLLEESRRFAGDLAVRLRERVYDSVIPKIAEGLVAARKIKKPTAADLAETYRMAMTVLFRLLFVAYAEDKDLLPFKWNGLYQKRSLKEKARELLMLHEEGKQFDTGAALWEEVDRLFRAVEEGNTEWGVPAYGGELFSRDATESTTGARLSSVKLSNDVFGPALRDLLLIETKDSVLGPVDFRSLGVREFGTVYEGLLESELARAEADLTTDKDGNYRPAKAKETVVVKAGEVYLHNSSGQRKATGTYFTKEFAVDHLLEEALEPALKDHVARIDALDDTAAAERFFDFRVADIAMGSAHFLVAAVDRIERAFSGYLAERSKKERPLAGVRAELAALRAAAETALGELKDQIEIEDTQLLRRQIARRCIYGVDMNPVAVSLARLSIWIHTFVPGLPLSLLDHTLVCGNSLVGIGRVDEIQEAVTAVSEVGKNRQKVMGGFDAEELLGDALEPLGRVAKAADATLADVRRTRAALKEAEKAVASASALCDIVTACRITQTDFPFNSWSWAEEKGRLTTSAEHAAATEALKHLPPFHFPVAFPEVFLRDRSGFDVLLGNPPWEKTQVEEHGFWGRHLPGLRSLTQREREAKYTQLRSERPDLAKQLDEETAETEGMRAALMNGPYPGMGSGHPDLYKAFCWRFWNLISPDGGRLGVVLPRSALAAKGSELFRKAVFAGARMVSVTTLVNRANWVFDGMEIRYTIGLVALCRGKPVDGSIGLRGPFNSLARYRVGHESPLTTFAAADVLSWTDTASLPLLPAEESLAVFAQLRTSPRLDLNDGKSWRARPLQGDMNSTADKPLMDLVSEERPEGFWPVCGGASFDLWTPDTGEYYAWADPNKVLPDLLETQKRGAKSKASPFYEFQKDRVGKMELLPCQSPRIAFRRISRATDTRTMRCALVPPRVFLTDVAPYLLFPRGDVTDVAYLLGVLSSLPLDWYTRRFAETHMDFHVFNPLPIPRPATVSPLRKGVVALAGRLAAVDERFAVWAKSVGTAYGPLEDAAKHDHIHELDAVVAHLYGLTEPQLVHVFETFHEGWDYKPRLAATLTHYRAWKENSK